MMNRIVLLTVLLLSVCNVFAREYFVGGAGASDNNPGTTSQPFATIQKAASVAVAGDVIKIRSGTYRESIVPANSGSGGNPIIFQPDNGASVIISGLNVIPNDGWSVHNGNIYKKSITLPVNGFNATIANNTTLAANQIFQNGVMQIEARWPNATTPEELLDREKWRPRRQTVSWNSATIVDNGIPNIGWAGAKIFINGWYVAHTKTIASQSGNTLTYHGGIGDLRFLQNYYLTGKLGGLDVAKEWHYEGGTLYFYQNGGGSPSGLIEYKARNYAFDLSNRSNINIVGVKLMGCEINGNGSTSNITIDGISASYLNHVFLQEGGDIVVFTALQTGFKLLGGNNTVKNSVFKYSASTGIWLGDRGVAQNNLMTHMGYDGNYGSPIALYGSGDNIKILRNTIHDVGRQCIDFGQFQNGTGHHLNTEIGYNDMYNFCMLSADGGATYAARYYDLRGTRIHHNWIHNSKAVHADRPYDVGINAGIYYDMATGSGTINDHNVLWDNRQGDIHISTAETISLQMHRGRAYIYNNTFATKAGEAHGHTSYLNVVTEYFDVMRNNIYRNRCFINFNEPNGSFGDVRNSLMEKVDPMFAGGSTVNPINVPNPENYFQLKSGSPAINTGTNVPGITDGSVGVPDIGAYEFGGEKWVPGYRPVAQQAPVNTPPVVSITAPANNASVAQGTAITINANATDADGTVSRVEFYANATKIGEDLTSPYTFSWTNATVGTHAITAKATDNQNAATTSSTVSVSVTATSGPPTINLTAPANNAQVVSGAAVTITATASDAGGSIKKVEFFYGTTKLGEDSNSPYSFSWANAPVGAHQITAKATDNEDNTTVSAVINITVTNPVVTGTNPVVAITAPKNNSNFTLGTAILISANATDAGGSIAKVEFFNGTTKLGEDLTTPYSFNWTNAPTGAHKLTAKATDNQTNVTTSAVINLTVAAGAVANVNPVISITAPSNNASIIAGENITVSVTATDAGGSITKVEFYNGTTKIGEDTSGPFSFVWSDAPVGTHNITAKATDNLGASTTSAAINVQVRASVEENIIPIVALTAPSEGTQVFAGANVTIAATASDVDGPIIKVEFFEGTTKLGEDATSPYSFEWSGVQAGSYSITAVAHDDKSGIGTSLAITLIVDELGTDGPESVGLYSGIPRFFSPNGDGTGDRWIWADREEYRNSILRVSNRAGQLVYESSSYDNSWDGSADGRPLQDGDYYFVISMPSLVELKGAVRIIR
jgi:gliding motility-associated-like protein